MSSFFDNYKRVYLHCTTELENRSSLVAECSLSIEVTAELGGNFTSVEHLQTEYLSIPPGAQSQHTFSEVSKYFDVSQVSRKEMFLEQLFFLGRGKVTREETT